MQLKIEYLDKESLKPYANNAKVHTAEQVEQIKNSIREFGFNDPIAVWHDNEIVEGHGRLLAAMEMDDIKTVPVIRLDDLTDEQRRAYMLAHNKLTMNTDFDLDLLSMEVAELSGGLDLTDFGFNEREILELTIDDSPEYGVPVQSQAEPSATYTESGHVTSEGPGLSFEYGSQGGFEPGAADAPISKEEMNAYEKNAETLVTRRVIIVYSTEEEEQFLKKILAQDQEKPLGVVFDIKNIMKAAKYLEDYGVVQKEEQ